MHQSLTMTGSFLAFHLCVGLEKSSMTISSFASGAMVVMMMLLLIGKMVMVIKMMLWSCDGVIL